VSTLSGIGKITVFAPTNDAITTLGGVFYLSNRGTTGVFLNGRTKVIATDILADNGVVHVIDRTLLAKIPY
jgi:uncharacterized surface protein with fasciclin (FAS1) repeats